MDDGPLPGARFTSEEERFGRFNFQREEELTRMEEMLRCEAPPSFFLLVGEVGMGRSYFLDAACRRTRLAGSALSLLRLDFDGLEDYGDPPLEVALVRFVEYQLDQRRQPGRTADRRWVPLARSLANRGVGLWQSAALLALGLGLDETQRALEVLLEQSSRDSFPDGGPRQVLGELLSNLTTEGAVMVHVPDPESLVAPLRRWLVEVVEDHDQLHLALSCVRGEPDVALPQAPERFEFSPLTHNELQELVSRRFAADVFPQELVQDLLDSSAGRPGAVAAVLSGLVRQGRLRQGPTGAWSLPEETGPPEDGEDGGAAPGGPLYEPIRQRLQELPQADDLEAFLDLAALCGRHVPAALLLEYLGLDAERRETLIDTIDEHFVEDEDLGFFEDLEFRHPAFPTQGVYRFAHSLLPRLILQRLSAWDREDRAAGLLAFLRERLPVETRGVASLYRFLAEHLDVQTQAPYLGRLAWWIGRDEVHDLERDLKSAIARGALAPDVLWRVANESQVDWPAFRRAVLLSAYGGQEGGVPWENLGPYSYVKARVLLELGQLQEATEAAEEAVQVFHRESGKESLQWSRAANLVAVLYHTQGRSQEAEPLLQQTLALYRDSLGPEHPEVVTALNNLAAVYHAQGRFGEAEPLMHQALDLKEGILGEDHPEIAQSLNQLAELYRAQDRQQEVEPLLKRAMAIVEESLGPDHPAAAAALNNLAELYRSQRRFEEAVPLLQRALAVREKSLGVEHLEVAQSLNNLAGLYHTQGRSQDAEPLLERSLDILEKSIGAEHPDVATALSNLAELRSSQGKTEEARAPLERALVILEKSLGPDHPDVAQTLNNLAGLYHVQGRHEEGEPLLRRALAVREKSLGPDHPDVAQSLNNLAELYRAQGRFAEAEPLYRRCLAVWERSLPSHHPWLARGLENYARLLRSLGRDPEAAEVEARAQRMRAQGETHEGDGRPKKG